MLGSIVLIAILVLAAYLKLNESKIIGKNGEHLVSAKLRQLDNEKYFIIDDVLIPSSGNTVTTQIDHVVVSGYGVFCIETKNYSGWIFGNAYKKYWTKTMYKKKYKFYNPMRQNYAHKKTLESILGGVLKEPVVPFVIFPSAGKIKVSGTKSVGHIYEIIDRIKSYHVALYSGEEVEMIVNTINAKNITDKEIRRQHIKDIRQMRR